MAVIWVRSQADLDHEVARCGRGDVIQLRGGSEFAIPEEMAERLFRVGCSLEALDHVRVEVSGSVTVTARDGFEPPGQG